jgi:hypothetical protein
MKRPLLQLQGAGLEMFEFSSISNLLYLKRSEIIGIVVTGLSRTGRHLCTCPDMIGLVSYAICWFCLVVLNILHMHARINGLPILV